MVIGDELVLVFVEEEGCLYMFDWSNVLRTGCLGLILFCSLLLFSGYILLLGHIGRDIHDF